MSDIDLLFEQQSIAELLALRDKSNNSINEYQSELRTLVAEKYRDLLHVADNIIEMNSTIKKSNPKLAQLTFSKANYDSNHVPNLMYNDRHLRESKLANVKKRNNSHVLNNIIHDFNYSLLNLKAATRDDDQNNSPNSFSDSSLKLAKLCYLIQLIFKVDSKPSSNFSIIKYKQLQSEFLELIENQIVVLNCDQDADLFINLLISRILVLHSDSPFDIIKWSFNIRFNKLKEFYNTWSLIDILTYIFNSIQLYKSSVIRLPNLLSRHLSSSSLNGLNWISQTSLQKWSSWLDLDDNFDISFPKLELSISNDQSDSFLNIKKLEIGTLMKFSFDFKISKTDSKINLINNYLLNLKQFSSLCDLEYEKSKSLIDYIIGLLNDSLSVNNTKQLENLKQICNSLLANLGDLNYVHSIRTNSGINLFNETPLNSLITQFNLESKAQTPDVELFQKCTQNILSTLESVKNLSKFICKPVISVDDFDNDEFWIKLSDTLKSIVNKSIDQANSVLSITFDEFLNEINHKIDNCEKFENIQWLFLIRSLIAFENEFHIEQFQKLLSEINSNSKLESIAVNDRISRIILKAFVPIFDSLLCKYSEELTYTKDPNLFNISIEGTLMQIIWELKRPLGNEDFSDVFEIKLNEFSKIKDDFFTKLSSTITEYITKTFVLEESEDANISNKDELKQRSLVCYCNYVFIENMKSETGLKESDNLKTILKKYNSDFESEEKMAALETSIKDHYNAERLLFYPFL